MNHEQQHTHDGFDNNHHQNHIFTLGETLRIGLVFFVLILSWLTIWPPFFQFKYIGFIATLVGNLTPI
jgi:hypothetical protein